MQTIQATQPIYSSSFVGFHPVHYKMRKRRDLPGFTIRGYGTLESHDRYNLSLLGTDGERLSFQRHGTELMVSWSIPGAVLGNWQLQVARISSDQLNLWVTVPGERQKRITLSFDKDPEGELLFYHELEVALKTTLRGTSASLY